MAGTLLVDAGKGRASKEEWGKKGSVIKAELLCEL